MLQVLNFFVAVFGGVFMLSLFGRTRLAVIPISHPSHTGLNFTKQGRH
jgi:hypothetical protein